MLWRLGETLLILAAIVAFVIFVEDGDWGGVAVIFVVFGLLKGVEMWRERRTASRRFHSGE